MFNQKKKRENNRTQLWRFLLGAWVLCTALSLLGDLAAWVLYWMGGFSFAVHDAATIGIIGGADGPTAIFVTSSTVPVWQTMLKSMLLVMGLLARRHLNGK